MKLLFCVECRDAVSLAEEITRKCKCGKVAGKYLSDHITAVVTPSCVFGIDNNSFLNALATVGKVVGGEFEAFDQNKRYDFFFTGWIPTIPGEVIFVDTPEDVEAYDYNEKHSWTSENPNTGANE